MSSCVFCRIVKKDISSNVLHEDNNILAFRDIDPKAPVHFLVIPKKHIQRLTDAAPEDLGVLTDIHKVILDLAKRMDLVKSGFRLVLNNGPDAGQAVDHLHVHVLAGRKLSWPPG